MVKVSVRLLWPFLRIAGGDPRARDVLNGAELGPRTLGDAEARLLHQASLDLLRRAIETLPDPALGLRAGYELDGADLGAVERAARHAPTVGDCLELTIRHLSLFVEAARAAVTIHGDTAVLTLRTAEDATGLDAADDFVVAACVAFLRRNVPDYRPPLEVRVAHARPSYAAEYQRVLGTPVTFDAAENAVVFPKEWLERRMPCANAELLAVFEHQARRALTELGQQYGAAGLVRQAVSGQFEAGSVSMHDTARRLAMSVATLRRRLGDEGTTFADLVDELRRQRAYEHLREPHLTVSEVAFRVGFSGVVTFGRAFKRWSGLTPTEFRARVQDSSSFARTEAANMSGAVLDSAPLLSARPQYFAGAVTRAAS